MKLFNEGFEEIRDTLSEICIRNKIQIRFHADGTYIIESEEELLKSSQLTGSEGKK